jgi:hypothetical protein
MYQPADLINFQKGDPYIKVDEGFARLPGKGYEALHPEMEGVDPEHYSDISKLRILGDVAPYSREYQKYASILGKQSQGNPELQAEYEKIAEQVRQTKESTLQVAEPHFTAPIDQVEGSIAHADAQGFTLKELPGRTFRFSSIGSSMADLVLMTWSLPRAVYKIRRARGEAGRRFGRITACLPRRRPAGSGLKVGDHANSKLTDRHTKKRSKNTNIGLQRQITTWRREKALLQRLTAVMNQLTRFDPAPSIGKSGPKPGLRAYMLQSPLQSQTISARSRTWKRPSRVPPRVVYKHVARGARELRIQAPVAQLARVAKDLGDGITDPVLSTVHENHHEPVGCCLLPATSLPVPFAAADPSAPRLSSGRPFRRCCNMCM